VIRKFLALLTLLVLVPLNSVSSSANLARVRASAIANREIHDEPDPADVGDCIALGELDLIFTTENNGPPNVGVILTDPRGRRIGFDPLTKSSWDDLPMAQGFINCDASYAHGRCRGVVQVCGPVSGGYKLEVIGQKASIYSVGLSARSKRTRLSKGFHNSLSEADIRHIEARRGSRDIFLVNYSREVDTEIAVQMQRTLKPIHRPVALRVARTFSRQAPRAGTLWADRQHTTGD
jgi:hypothetical protein